MTRGASRRSSKEKLQAREADDSKSSPDTAAAETSADARAAARAAPRNGARSLLAGAVGGIVVSALGLGAGYSLLTSKADGTDTENRLGALEAQARQTNDALGAEANRESAAVAALEKRIGALEASAGASNTTDLDKRVDGVGSGQRRKWRRQRRDPAFGGSGQGLARRRRRREGRSFLTCRRASRSSNPTRQRRAPPAPISPRSRLVSTRSRAPSPRPRAKPVAAEKPAAADNAATIAIIAEVAEERLRSGAGFGPELAALQRLGVDSAALAPLQAVVNGAPTNGALAASFDAVAPHVLAATSAPEQGSVTDRFLAHLHNLVKVRELNETAGDDPQALVSQIEAASRRGDIGAALASFDKLPEAARKAAGDWPTLARARAAADAALQSIREAAVGQLAGGPKP